MTVNSRSAHRYSFKCPCCQSATSGKERKAERRRIKRRERQAVKSELRKVL